VKGREPHVGIETSSLHWSRQGGVSRLLRNFLGSYRSLNGDGLQLSAFHYLPGNDPLYLDFPDLTPDWAARFPGKMREKLMPVAVRTRSFDLVHYPCEDLSPFFWAAAPRVVVTVHAAALHSLPPEVGGVRQPRSWWFSLRHLNRLITRVITDSEFAKKEIAEHYLIPPDKIRVVPLGVDGQVFRPGPLSVSECERLRQKYGVKGPYLLDVCSSHQALKNIPRLLQAFALCRRRGLKHSLVLAGPGGGWQAEKVGETIEALQLEESVIPAGFIEEKDLPLLYRGADLFVFPSLYEGFGLPILEAMACGCPVITSRTSSLPEVGGPAAVLIDPCDVGGLAETIFSLAKNSRARATMRQAGIKRAAGYAWEATARATSEVYRECLLPPRARK